VDQEQLKKTRSLKVLHLLESMLVHPQEQLFVQTLDQDKSIMMLSLILSEDPLIKPDVTLLKLLGIILVRVEAQSMLVI
jgi:hypothetical protein